MRDLETIEAALRIAETGHLTLATLHTNSATTSINRIIDVFPAHQQSQIRTQLSFVLEGIMCQTLHRALERQGPRHGARGPDPERRRPQPDPRGQDPPDLLDDADRPVQVRHADVQPVARDPVPEEADHARGGALPLVDARRAAGAHQPRRRRQRADRVAATAGKRTKRCPTTSGREETARARPGGRARRRHEGSRAGDAAAPEHRRHRHPRAGQGNLAHEDGPQGPRRRSSRSSRGSSRS